MAPVGKYATPHIDWERLGARRGSGGWSWNRSYGTWEPLIQVQAGSSRGPGCPRLDAMAIIDSAHLPTTLLCPAASGHWHRYKAPKRTRGSGGRHPTSPLSQATAGLSPAVGNGSPGVLIPVPEQAAFLSFSLVCTQIFL